MLPRHQEVQCKPHLQEPYNHVSDQVAHTGFVRVPISLRTKLIPQVPSFSMLVGEVGCLHRFVWKRSQRRKSSRESLVDDYKNENQFLQVPHLTVFFSSPSQRRLTPIRHLCSTWEGYGKVVDPFCHKATPPAADCPTLRPSKTSHGQIFASCFRQGKYDRGRLDRRVDFGQKGSN